MPKCHKVVTKLQNCCNCCNCCIAHYNCTNSPQFRDSTLSVQHNFLQFVFKLQLFVILSFPFLLCIFKSHQLNYTCCTYCTIPVNMCSRQLQLPTANCQLAHKHINNEICAGGEIIHLPQQQAKLSLFDCQPHTVAEACGGLRSGGFR